MFQITAEPDGFQVSRTEGDGCLSRGGLGHRSVYTFLFPLVAHFYQATRGEQEPVPLFPPVAPCCSLLTVN